MESLKNELDANFGNFTNGLLPQFQNAYQKLGAENKVFNASYRRISTLQAWRTSVIRDKLGDAPCVAFFLEAQNDFLVSHSLARFGAWRPALKALRSALENICQFIYYKDHPVEYRQWENGSFRASFADLFDYITKHPDLRKIPDKNLAKLAGLQELKNEYAELSRAVHASSKPFRMTDNLTFPSIVAPDQIRLGRWATREAATIRCVNKLLVILFELDLKGTSYRHLRQSLSFSLSDKNYTSSVKAIFKINIPAKAI